MAATQSGKPSIYQLKVTLLGTQPPIWRRLQVEGDSTLADLHDAVQFAMDWTDSHLHEFMIGDRHFSDAMDDEGLGSEAEDEAEFLLSDVLPAAGKAFRYVYDFGDSWEHEILVEKLLPADPEVVYPVCTGGQRAAPPEDVGGVSGFEHFLDVMANPADSEHEEYVDWFGGEYDPDEFDLEEINTLLQEDSMPEELVSVLSTEHADFVYDHSSPYAKFYLFRRPQQDLAAPIDEFAGNGHHDAADELDTERMGILMLSITPDGFEADLYLDSDQVEETEVEGLVESTAELLGEVDPAGHGGFLAVHWTEAIGIWEFPEEE